MNTNQTQPLHQSQQIQQTELQHVDWKYGKDRVDIQQDQSKATMMNPQKSQQYELQQDDSPGVARARRLLSTMKVQREQAFVQLRNSTLIEPKSTNGNDPTNATTTDTKDVTYYETLHQRLRNRIEQKLALSSSQHERSLLDSQVNNVKNEQVINKQSPNSDISKHLESKIGNGDRSIPKKQSYHSDDNNTVSTAQSTICHSITTSSSLSRQSFHSYRPTRNDDSFTTFASQDIIKEDMTYKPPPKKAVGRSIKATAQKIRNPPVTPATEEMIAELTTFLSKCNETKHRRNQSDHSNVKNLKENRESLRALDKSKQTESTICSTKDIPRIKQQEKQQQQHPPKPPKHILTTNEVDSRTIDTKESGVAKEQPKSSLSAILNITNCKVSPSRRRQLSPRSRPIIRSQSSHPRSSKGDVWRTCNNRSQSVRQARSYDESEFEGTKVQRPTKSPSDDWTGLLFLSASADDADPSAEPRKRSRQRGKKPTSSIKFVQKPINNDNSITVSALKEKLNPKVESKHRSHRDNEIQTVLSGGGSTASVTISSGSSSMEEIHTDENDQVPNVQSSLSRPQPVSPTLPLHIHSLHNRSNSGTKSSLFRKDASSPLRSVRSNSLSPRRVRGNKNTSKKQLSMTDVNTPVLVSTTTTSASSASKSITTSLNRKNVSSPVRSARSNSLSPKRVRDNKNATNKLMTMNDIDTPFLVPTAKPTTSLASKTGDPSKDKKYSTNWFLSTKVVTNEDIPSTTTNTATTQTLDTPEERKVFIRDLYRTKPNIVNTLPSEMEPSESSMGCQSNGSTGVRSIIAAFQEINSTIQNEMDAPIRIKAEYQSKKQHLDSIKSTITNSEPIVEKETNTAPLTEMDGIQKESTTIIPSITEKRVEFSPTPPEVAVLERRNETLDDESVTLDNTLDEDYTSDYTTDSDTSGWISNSSTTFTTLDYDTDRGSPNKLIGSVPSFPSLDGKKTKKKKDNKRRVKNPQSEKSDLASITAISSFAGSTRSNDESYVDTVSLLSNGFLDEPQYYHPSTIKICGLARNNNNNKEKELHRDRHESFSSFGEIHWNDSPRKRRVCFAPDNELEQLEVFHIDESTYTDEDEEQKEEYEDVVVKARLLFIPEDVADENCFASGGLYNLALSRNPIIVVNDTESYPIQVRKGKAKNMLYQWSTDFRCGTRGSHFDIARRSGCKVISNKPLRKQVVEKGNVESEAGFLTTNGGLYYMALQSGLTKKALNSKEPYNVVVNLRGATKKNKQGKIIPEVISDHRCGATGGWYYLASSRIKIQKRRPLEEDVYMVN